MKAIFLFASAMLLFVGGIKTQAFGQTVFKVGDKIPDFKLPYATKDTIVFDGISSKDLIGKRYLLAFYPADWSGGCTKEVCRLRDTMADFEGLNVEVFGVSVDNLFSHRAWAKSENLNFKLISDQTHKLGQPIGVYNDEYGVFNRSVFVVGPDGKFQYINYNYSVKDDKDFDALKEALASK
jgi:peroxiredoxin